MLQKDIPRDHDGRYLDLDFPAEEFVGPPTEKEKAYDDYLWELFHSGLDF